LKGLLRLVAALDGNIINAENKSSSHPFIHETSVDKARYSSPAPTVTI